MELIFLILIFLFSVVIHEVSHGLTANHLGDPTARLAGRLSLNPIKHLDPIGSVLLPLILILSRVGIVLGWAKPVPINPYNFRDQKYGEIKTALAGPGANILIAVIFSLLLRLISGLYISGTGEYMKNLEDFFSRIVFVNLLLAIFNLIPVPPLDGSYVLFFFLGHRLDKFRPILEQFGFIILIFILLLFFPVLAEIVIFFHKIFTGGN